MTAILRKNRLLFTVLTSLMGMTLLTSFPLTQTRNGTLTVSQHSHTYASSLAPVFHSELAFLLNSCLCKMPWVFNYLRFDSRIEPFDFMLLINILMMLLFLPSAVREGGFSFTQYSTNEKIALFSIAPLSCISQYLFFFSLRHLNVTYKEWLINI